MTTDAVPTGEQHSGEQVAPVRHYRTGPGKCSCGFNAYRVGGFFPDYHQMLMDHLGRHR